MATMIRIFLFLYFITFSGFFAFSQEKDFGIWYGCNLEKSVLERLDAQFSTSIRTENNAKSINQLFIEGGLQYQPLKHIAISGFYRYISKPEDNSDYYASHRLYSDIKTWYSYNRFKLSIRERLQWQKNTYIKNDVDLLSVYYSRLKAELVYNIRGIPVNANAYGEWFYPLDNSPLLVDQRRLSIGVSYKFKKKQSVDFAYIYKREIDTKIKDTNILSISYSFKF
jgi:hypothetical protein